MELEKEASEERTKAEKKEQTELEKRPLTPKMGPESKCRCYPANGFSAHFNW